MPDAQNGNTMQDREAYWVVRYNDGRSLDKYQDGAPRVWKFSDIDQARVETVEIWMKGRINGHVERWAIFAFSFDPEICKLILYFHTSFIMNGKVVREGGIVLSRDPPEKRVEFFYGYEITKPSGKNFKQLWALNVTTGEIRSVSKDEIK